MSVGIVGGRPLLDLCYTEDVEAAVDLNLVMNSAGEFIEVQGTGEEATFTEAQLADLLALGKAGIRDLLAAQEKALLDQGFRGRFSRWAPPLEKMSAKPSGPSASHAPVAHPPRRG